jgi:putative membrane protein
LTAVLLILAVASIKKGKIKQHAFFMKTAIVFSVVFLVLYVLYHMTSDSTEYKGEGLLRYLYFFILISHIVLSIAVIPFVLITYVRAITNQVELHKKIAKYTFPLWLYVAVTGVVVYWMISPYYVL